MVRTTSDEGEIVALTTSDEGEIVALTTSDEEKWWSVPHLMKRK